MSRALWYLLCEKSFSLKRHLFFLDLPAGVALLISKQGGAMRRAGDSNGPGIKALTVAAPHFLSHLPQFSGYFPSHLTVC